MRARRSGFKRCWPLNNQSRGQAKREEVQNLEKDDKLCPTKMMTSLLACESSGEKILDRA